MATDAAEYVAAQAIEREVAKIAKRDGITKLAAYNRFLATPEGLRARAQTLRAKGDVESWSQLHKAANALETYQAVKKNHL